MGDHDGIPGVVLLQLLILVLYPLPINFPGTASSTNLKLFNVANMEGSDATMLYFWKPRGVVPLHFLVLIIYVLLFNLPRTDSSRAGIEGYQSIEGGNTIILYRARYSVTSVKSHTLCFLYLPM